MWIGHVDLHLHTFDGHRFAPKSLCATLVWPVERIDIKEILRLVPLPMPEVDMILDDMMGDPAVGTHRGTIDEPMIRIMTSFTDAR